MLREVTVYRCDGCGEQCDENELTELEFFQGIPIQNLCSKCMANIFVKGRKRNEKRNILRQ
jgi:DNA-directed RNA polymerase subunit RPC12/RpoP